MTRLLRKLMFLLVMGHSFASFAQSDNEFVPCQEMPNLMLQFNADYRVLVRFYTPTAGGNAGRGGFNFSPDAGVGSPEKRERINKL
ncbi:MAG: hypothetical protein EOP49_48830, partial [Sphingobacteriales bacterium]